MTSNYFKRVKELFKVWPADPLKTHRDFLNNLQKQILIWFPKGDLSKIENLQKLDKQISALERINANIHKKKYNDRFVTKLNSASSIPLNEIKNFLTTSYLEENKKMEKISNRFLNELKNSKITQKFIDNKK